MIFDESTLRKLNTLTLIASKVRAGVMKGDRRSSKRGTSIEFTDFRDYVPGDDLRRLDWKAYGRLDKPFIKLFEEEEDLAVHVLIDASKSMDRGIDAQNKFVFARRLAASIGTITLSTGDWLTVSFISSGQKTSPGSITNQYGPSRGIYHTLRFLTFLDEHRTGGLTDLNQSLTDYSLATHRPGLTFLLNDLFTPDGYRSGFSQLQSRGHELVLIHILAPEEIDPPLSGNLRLLDIETDNGQEISIDNSLRHFYHQRLKSWLDEIQTYCRKHEFHYLPLSTTTPWDKIVLQKMRREGIVK